MTIGSAFGGIKDRIVSWDMPDSCACRSSASTAFWLPDNTAISSKTFMSDSTDVGVAQSGADIGGADIGGPAAVGENTCIGAGFRGGGGIMR